MATIRDIKMHLKSVDAFRQRNAPIVAPVHEFVRAAEQSESVENGVRRLFFSLRDQICKDSGLPPGTPFDSMKDHTVISAEAEEKTQRASRIHKAEMTELVIPEPQQ